MGFEQAMGHVGSDLAQCRRRVEGVGGVHRHDSACVGVVVAREHQGRVLPLCQVDEVLNGQGPAATPPGDGVGEVTAGNDRGAGGEGIQAIARDDVDLGGLRAGQLRSTAGGHRDLVAGADEGVCRGPTEGAGADDRDVFHGFSLR